MNETPIVKPVSATPKLRGRGRLRAYAVTLVVVLAIAAILRVIAVDRFSLGNDEIAEVRWSYLSWGELFRVAADEEAHPPLELFAQGLLSRLRVSDWVRRLPGITAGIVTVALSIHLATRWFGPAAGIAAGLLLSFSPIHVRFSQEVRPYSMGLLLLLASVSTLEEYRRSRRKLLIVAWFLAVLGAAYTLYFAGLLSVMVSLVYIFAYRRVELRSLWRLLPFVILGWIVLYLPWLPVVFSVGGRRPPVEREILDRSWLRYRFQALGTGDWQVEPISIGSYVFWLLVILGLVLAWRSRPAAIASLWLVLGGLVQVTILQLRPHFPAVRHFLPSWLGAVFLAAYAIGSLCRTRAAWLGWVALAVVLFFDARTLIAYYDHGRPAWDKVAMYLRARVPPGERLVAANGWVYRNLGYYWNQGGTGRVDVPLQRAGAEIIGPSWIVLAVCPVDPAVQSHLERLRLVASFPTTNYCVIRFLPRGDHLLLPRGLCRIDV